LSFFASAASAVVDGTGRGFQRIELESDELVEERVDHGRALL
jgi:hypothetical protein